MRRISISGGFRSLFVIALAIVLALPTVAYSTPTNSDIKAKQSEATAAQAELDKMSGELETRVEAYNAITDALASTRAEIAKTREDLLAANKRLQTSQQRLSARVNDIYRGGNISVLEMLIGTTSFEDFVSRLDMLNRIGASDAEMVAQVKTDRNRVQSLDTSLKSREAEQIALQTDAESRANVIKSEVAKQQSYIASLNSEVQKLITEEKEREAKAAAAAAAAARARYAQQATTSTGRTSTSPAALGGGSSAVVKVALQYLGVPYHWGSRGGICALHGGPAACFDCSGLCQYVYAKVGIDLPRTAASQYRVGQHIDQTRLDLLKPGDLVFFGTNCNPSRVHHVGLYIGDDQFIEAPRTGENVTISSLSGRIARSHEYVGASRF